MATRPLYGMFNTVTRRYDLLNRLMTLGLDQWWRRRAARECLTGGPERILDLCCGTGDLALLIARLATEDVEIVAADFAENMLAEAQKKAGALKDGEPVLFLQADASALPFPDHHFPVIAISFAFRNITFKNPKRDAYLSEILRVLAPGGRFVIVETSQPKRCFMRWGFHLYMALWVGWFGGLLSGRRGAYRYLASTAIQFPPPEGVEKMLIDAGFQSVEYTPLLGGTTGIHVAVA